MFYRSVWILIEIIFYRLHCDFSCHLVRETELAGRDTAEGDTLETVFIGTSHNAAVARSQLFLLKIRRDAVWDDGAYCVNDVFAWQIVRLGDFRLSSRLGMSLFEHDGIAFLAQLHAGSGMDGVVDAPVQWVETTQHLTVGGVDDGVDLQTRNVALPNCHRRRGAHACAQFRQRAGGYAA